LYPPDHRHDVEEGSVLNSKRGRFAIAAYALLVCLLIYGSCVSTDSSAVGTLHPMTRDAQAALSGGQVPASRIPFQEKASPVPPSCSDCDVGNLSVGIAPWTPTFDASASALYVSDWTGGNAGTVSVVNVPLDFVVASLAVGIGPFQPALDPANGNLYVSNYGSDNVSVIAGANHTLVASVPVGREPEAAAVDPLTGQVFVANFGDGTVSVIDGSTNTVTAVLMVGGGPFTPTFDPSNGDMYLPTGSEVDVIAPNSASVVKSIPVGSDPAVLYDPENNQLYVANFGSATVSIIAGANNRVVSTLSVGTYPTIPVLDPTSGNVYVVNDGSNNVSVISGLTDTIVATIPVGRGPVSPAYDPGGGDMVVPNAYSDNVSIVSDGSLSVVATVAAGSNPATPVYVPTQHMMYVPNFFSDFLTEVGLAAPAVYPVTFVEAGLPSNTIWGMTSSVFGLATGFSSGSEISFPSPNGTYWYVANAVGGYAPSESNFTVSVRGEAVEVGVYFGPIRHAESPWELLEDPAFVAVGLTGGAILTLMVTRWRKRTSPPSATEPR
jgi:YVTN family beta-propeller protein